MGLNEEEGVDICYCHCYRLYYLSTFFDLYITDLTMFL